MKDEILRLIASPPKITSELVFNNLALRLFQYQYNQNRPYRQFCLSKGITPNRLQKWEEIPFLPVTAFKWADIVCRPRPEAARYFYSSGTTQAKKSRHTLFDLEVAEQAIATHFKHHLLPDRDQIQLIILTPSPKEAPHASLSHMMGVVSKRFGTQQSDYYIKAGRLQSERLTRDLAKTNQPVALLGTSLAFAHFIDYCLEKEFSLTLPPESRLMDTGGSKGASRECASEWIYKMAEKLWGIVPAFCVNEYGMAEMTSQFYDHISGDRKDRVYTAPTQARTQVLSPETLQPVAEGEVGLLAHLDLANIDSVAAILTEDLGQKRGNCFTLLGRAALSEAKGCSISADEFLIRSAVASEGSVR